jgi:5'-methylthioadenosine phosphorylase|tara:strand:+ start:2973 stop:3782 length:810 start_codon:yes stop_codon:yes gene_type:complete
MANADIGIIGGTGVYDQSLLENIEQINIETPYGKPSDVATVGTFAGVKVAFIPRHGPKHTIPPHMINYRANIHAFKELGVKWILAPQAVGSLQENYRPGELVFADQFIDRTWGRPKTFYDGPKVCHISVAEPFCKDLRKMLADKARELEYGMHDNGTYVCIQGPRFSTKAESKVFQQWNGHVIGMTAVPECVLAREAEICYASIGMVTDYDVWKEHAVSIEEILKVMGENEGKVKNLIKEIIPKIPEVLGERKCECATALQGALIGGEE